MPAEQGQIGRALTVPLMSGRGRERRDNSSFAREVAHRGYLPNLRPLLASWRWSPQLDRLPAYERAKPLLFGVSTPPMEPSRAPQLSQLPLAALPKAAVAGPTGIWGMVFTMCSATLGAGALSLPYAVSQMGLVPGVVLLVATAAATYHSISLLIAAMEATRLHSYEELTVHAFGQRMGVLVEVCRSHALCSLRVFSSPSPVSIITFCFGTCVAYTVAAGDILEPMLRTHAVQALASSLPVCGWLLTSKRRVLCLLWAVVMLPLSLAENLSAFEASSTFGVVSLIYLVLSVAGHAAYECVTKPEETVGEVQLFIVGPSSLSALAILLFAFTCQVNVPSMYAELENRDPETMRVISHRSALLCLACYALIGCAGYANFPEHVHGNVLSNYRLDEPHSRMMAPSFLAILLTVLMAYPLNIFPCRYAIGVIVQRSLAAWKGEDPPSPPASPPGGEGFGSAYAPMPARRRVVLTLIIAGLSLLIALFVPGINIVFQLMGGTASAFVCFILPAAFAWHYNLPEVRSRSGKLACAALFIVGIVVSVLSTSVTVSEML